jgi:hypothetical protein
MWGGHPQTCRRREKETRHLGAVSRTWAACSTAALCALCSVLPTADRRYAALASPPPARAEGGGGGGGGGEWRCALGVEGRWMGPELPG